MWIASTDCRGIQTFIFQSQRLRFIRKASGKLDDIEASLDATAQNCKGRLFFAAGGVSVAGFGGKCDAERYIAEVQKAYSSVGMRVTGAVTEAEVAVRAFENLLRARTDLDREKDRSDGVQDFISAQPLTISDIGVGPAAVSQAISDDDSAWLTAEAEAVWNWAGQSDRLEWLRSEWGARPGVEWTDDSIWPIHPEHVLDQDEDGRPQGLLALVYADVNNMGQWWKRFGGSYNEAGTLVSSVSRALKSAVLCAVEQLDCCARDRCRGGRRAPLMPLIWGGDDIAFLCPAEYALDVALSLCSEFERHTARCDDDDDWPGTLIFQVLEPTPPCLSLGVGIVMTKPSFPLYTSFRMAKDLQSNAKTLSRVFREKSNIETSALDFMVLQSAYQVSVREARERMHTTYNVHAHCRPYLAGANGAVSDDAPHITQLLGCVRLLQQYADASGEHFGKGDIKELHHLLFGPQSAGKQRMKDKLTRSTNKRDEYRQLLTRWAIHTGRGQTVNTQEQWPLRTYPALAEVYGVNHDTGFSPFSDIAETHGTL